MEEDGQNARVLRHLKKFGSITSMQAFQLYGITRLSGRIFDLRKCGVKIKDCFCEDVNRYGKTVRFKKYFIYSFEVPLIHQRSLLYLKCPTNNFARKKKNVKEDNVTSNFQ